MGDEAGTSDEAGISIKIRGGGGGGVVSRGWWGIEAINGWGGMEPLTLLGRMGTIRKLLERMGMVRNIVVITKACSRVYSSSRSFISSRIGRGVEGAN